MMKNFEKYFLKTKKTLDKTILNRYIKYRRSKSGYLPVHRI